MKVSLEKISRILFWVAVFLFVILLVWWLIGDSPGLKELVSVLTVISFYLALEARSAFSQHSKKTLNKLDSLEKASEETLKNTRSLLKKNGN